MSNLDSKDIKKQFGERAKDYIVQGLGRQLKCGKMLCVFHEEKTPSFSWYREGLCFKCMSCSKTMDIYKYMELYEGLDFKQSLEKVANMTGNYEKIDIRTSKEYKNPTKEFDNISYNALKFFNNRGISKSVVIDWKIQSVTKGEEYVVFRHFDNKGIVFNSFRSISTKKFLREKDTKSILYGIWKIDTSKKYAIIVEGHIDALTLSQCGVENVVSVPSGINELTWIENSYDFLNSLDTIIFWSDSDKQGIEGADKVRKRIGSDKVKIIMSNKYKDANEMFMQEGEKYVVNFIEENRSINNDCLINMGMRACDKKSSNQFYTGFPEVDRHFKKLQGSGLTILFGRDNEGKSTLISQVISNILNTDKVFLYSGEMCNDMIEEWMMRQVVGFRKGAFDVTNDEWGDKIFTVKKDIREKVRKWFDGKFYVYETKIELSEDSNLFKVMQCGFKKYGIKFFVVDNLMSAIEESNTTENARQTNFVKKCKQFAIENDVHVVLIAHPNKEGSNEGTELTKIHVSGSKNITNIADNIIAVERVWKVDSSSNLDSSGLPYTCILRCLKDRILGKRANFYFHFDSATNRFYNKLTPLESPSKALSKDIDITINGDELSWIHD